MVMVPSCSITTLQTIHVNGELNVYSFNWYRSRMYIIKLESMMCEIPLVPLRRSHQINDIKNIEIKITIMWPYWCESIFTSQYSFHTITWPNWYGSQCALNTIQWLWIWLEVNWFSMPSRVTYRTNVQLLFRLFMLHNREYIRRRWRVYINTLLVRCSVIETDWNLYVWTEQ